MFFVMLTITSRHDVLWKLAQDDLAEIEKVCREELVVAEERERHLKFNRSSLQPRQ